MWSGMLRGGVYAKTNSFLIILFLIILIILFLVKFSTTFLTNSLIILLFCVFLI